MLRHARTVGRTDLLRLAVSARTPHDLPYADELIAAGATVAFSRFAPPGGRATGRLRPEDVRPLLWSDAVSATTGFVCGSSGFAEAASVLLMDVGVPAEGIRVERFGPTGV
jgi:ferredoxin-NADP reductase